MNRFNAGAGWHCAKCRHPYDPNCLDCDGDGDADGESCACCACGYDRNVGAYWKSQLARSRERLEFLEGVRQKKPKKPKKK